MKIERFLGITIYLLNHKRVTAQTLSMRFEVTTRTIMRDINTLSLARITICIAFPDLLRFGETNIDIDSFL